MVNAGQNFIPVLTSEAGLCLTAENWQEAGVRTASCSLESLLYKPGLELLIKINKLGKYLGWQGNIILNTMTLKVNREGIFVLKSPYDGSRVTLGLKDLFAVIQHLKPQAVILPQNIIRDYPQIWDNWNDSTTPFIHAGDLEGQSLSRPHGVYFAHSLSSNWQQRERWSHLPRYAIGHFDPESIQNLLQEGVGFIESDEPARVAMYGTVYSRSGSVDLTDKSVQMLFEPIDSHCACPTCTQHLTKAYLHHLLQNTPLLCQRFLIQHNVFYIQNHLR